MNALRTVLLANLRAPSLGPGPRHLSRSPPSRTGIKMAHDVYGERTHHSPLIIMHGLFGSRSNWRSLSKAFERGTSPKRRVISVDARNHGDSPHSADHSYPLLAEDVRTLMEARGIDRAVLLGHSMGGRAVMSFALTHPHLVERLIVVDISPVSSSPSLHTTSEYFDVLRSVRMPPPHVPVAAARKDIDGQLATTVPDVGLRAFFLTNLKQDESGRYKWRMNLGALEEHFPHGIARFPVAGHSVAEYTGPTLFVSGEKSDYIQESDHAAISNLFPRAEFREIDGAGHWVHSEKPADFLDVALEFLNRPAAAADGTK